MNRVVHPLLAGRATHHEQYAGWTLDRYRSKSPFQNALDIVRELATETARGSKTKLVIVLFLVHPACQHAASPGCG